jgi:MarR family transcriptional regulator, organic hydroperoxide resistance regulator
MPGAKRKQKQPVRAGFVPPLTVSHAALLEHGTDLAFRETLYLMFLSSGRLQVCREAFGRALGLTGSQYAVLIGTAYRQGTDGVSIRALGEHIQLAPTHVTTEIGRLIRKGLIVKKVNAQDRRSVLVRLSARGEAEIERVTPLVRQINDLLFADISRREFAAVSHFLRTFAANSERALATIGRATVAHAEDGGHTSRRRASHRRWAGPASLASR